MSLKKNILHFVKKKITLRKLSARAQQIWPPQKHHVSDPNIFFWIRTFFFFLTCQPSNKFEKFESSSLADDSDVSLHATMEKGDLAAPCRCRRKNRHSMSNSRRTERERERAKKKKRQQKEFEDCFGGIIIILKLGRHRRNLFNGDLTLPTQQGRAWFKLFNLNRLFVVDAVALLFSSFCYNIRSPSLSPLSLSFCSSCYSTPFFFLH